MIVLQVNLVVIGQDPLVAEKERSFAFGFIFFFSSCKENVITVLSLINAPPLINAPLTYFQIKLGKMPKFLYDASL